MWEKDHEPAMTANSFCRLLLLPGLFVALAREAGAEAQVGGMADTGGPAGHSVETPVVEVRGDTPYVEIGGKRVAVSPGTIRFYPSNGPFPLFGKIPPNWVFASDLDARRVLLNHGEAFQMSVVNKEFRFSVDIESPTLLEKVWMIVTLSDDTGYKETLFREVGTLRPYKRTTASFPKRFFRELYDNPHIDWNLFAGGREVFHSLMSPETVAAGLEGIVSRMRRGVMEAEAEPYLTFPPRDSSKAKSPVKLELELDRRGFVKTASVVGGSDPKMEKNLLDAVRHWWFLPKRAGGRSYGCLASVVVDLSKWKTWSNDCVTLPFASRSSAPAPQGPGTTMSINPQEQSRPYGSAPRSGVALPVAVFQALPALPEEMAREGIEGKATVEFFVQSDGTVRTARAASQTDTSFGDAAVDCVKQWRFRPALRDGVPVGIRMWVPIVFTFAGCMPASPFDGYYDQAFLSQRYVTEARAQQMAEHVAGLKYPVSLSEFYASLGIPGGQIGVLRRLNCDSGTHIAHYQLNALGSAEKYYALTLNYTTDEQGSFANPCVTRAEIALVAPLPNPDFQIEETAGASRQP